MGNRDNWQYNSSLTVRIDKELKDRIEQEAKSKGINVSEWFRKICESEQLPGAFLDMLPDRHREFLEEHIKREELRTGKSSYDLISRLASRCIEDAMNKGFFFDFKRS